MQTCDVAVVGAGMVGVACAWELASAGLRVTLVEPNAVGSGGTNLGYGRLAVLDDSPGQLALTRYGLSLWNQLVEWLPAECEYQRCGSVWVALNEDQLAAAIQRSEVFSREGVRNEVLDSQQMAEAEPGLRPDSAGGLYVADDGWLRASMAAEFLWQLALKKGAKHVRHKATAIVEHEVRLADGTVLHAGNIVNATGTGAATLTPDLPLQYAKGHVLVVETPSRCVSHQVSEIAMQSVGGDEWVRFEARQNEYGEIWIGSSHQLTTTDASTQVEPKTVAAILRRAIEMVPAIGHAKPLRSWTGIRSETPDGQPLIGRMAAQEGVFVAAGHDAHGATAALATAKLIVDELLLRTPAIDPTPYLTDRFTRTKA